MQVHALMLLPGPLVTLMLALHLHALYMTLDRWVWVTAAPVLSIPSVVAGRVQDTQIGRYQDPVPEITGVATPTSVLVAAAQCTMEAHNGFPSAAVL
jgi:hypothetical protein